ncbi:hypothetical protein ABBQ38_010519 [Trebouxia sp. C0009 RCD-2024]
MAALSARPLCLVGICRLGCPPCYLYTPISPRQAMHNVRPRAAADSTDQRVAIGVRPITSTALPSWHRYLGPATLAAALFMVVVALWKLVLSKDGPTRLEKNLTAAVQLVDSVQSSTVDTLFNLFDQNHNGTIELCEVSWGLHKLKPQLPPEDARQQALQHFLLFDQGEQRHLDKQDFTVFLQRYCLLSDTKLSEIADDMIAKLSQPDRPSESAAASEDAIQQQMQAVSAHQVTEVYQERRLDAVFAMWDQNSDLRISFKELCEGLYRFSGVEKLKDKAAAAAQAILEPGIATDGGQQMSRQQFGTFIRRFAAASGVSFSAITDFLLVVPVFDYDPAFMDPGVKQLEKLIRKRLEEKRKDKAMRKAEKSEERARSQ